MHMVKIIFKFGLNSSFEFSDYLLIYYIIKTYMTIKTDWSTQVDLVFSEEQSKSGNPSEKIINKKNMQNKSFFYFYIIFTKATYHLGGIWWGWAKRSEEDT